MLFINPNMFFMKVTSNYIILCIVSLILCFSCKTETTQEKSSSVVLKENNTRPAIAITYKEMAAMFHQYDVGQKPVLDAYRKNFSGIEGDIETVSNFFDLAQLKQYIAYVEKLSEDKQIPLTGIRIFSAAYPKDYSDKETNGRQTLILMPTTNIGDSLNVAYEPLYSGVKQPIPFTKFLDKFSSKNSKMVNRASFLPLFNMQDDLESSGANRAQMRPPF